MKPRSLPFGFLAQQQVPQHLLQRRVAEPDLVDQSGRRRQEQVGAQAAEGRGPSMLAVAVAASGSWPWSTSRNSTPSESYRWVPAARLRGRELDQGEVAQPVEAVAALVLGGAGRQHAELG